MECFIHPSHKEPEGLSFLTLASTLSSLWFNFQSPSRLRCSPGTPRASLTPLFSLITLFRNCLLTCLLLLLIRWEQRLGLSGSSCILSIKCGEKTARHDEKRERLFFPTLLVAALKSGQRQNVNVAPVSISRYGSTLSLYKWVFFLEDGSKDGMKSETVVLIGCCEYRKCKCGWTRLVYFSQTQTGRTSSTHPCLCGYLGVLCCSAWRWVSFVRN